MPIYEYEAVHKDQCCEQCGPGFETIHAMNDQSLSQCPRCGAKVRRIISWCHSAVVDVSPEGNRVESKIKDYEQAGLWSHAAELADKYSEKTKDNGLKTRALDNYKKAGYDVDSLVKTGDKD